MMDTAQLNRPVSVERTQVGWSSTTTAITSRFVLTMPLKESGFLFELRVLGIFLKEMIGHPLSTSRVRVDSERRIIEIDRG
jgi:hypothetical protein